MKNIVKMSLIALSSVTLITACGDKGGGNDGGVDLRPLNITGQNLTGAWEIQNTIYNGTSYPAGTATPKGKIENRQLEITGNKISIILSDEIAATSVTTSDFVLENDVIVTQDGRRKSSLDYKVLALTGSTLNIRPLTKNIADNIEWQFRRIDISQLATNRVASSITQNFAYELQTGGVSLRESYQNTFTGTQRGNQQVEITCRLSGNNSLEIAFEKEGRRSQQGSRDQRSRNVDSEISLKGSVGFDLNVASETTRMTIGGRRQSGQSAQLVGNLPIMGSKNVYLSLGDNGRCEVQINRNKRLLTFSGNCSRIAANGLRLDNNASLKVQGSCVLDF